MFVLARLADSVRVYPVDFNKTREEAITDELNKKYANKVVYGVGLCICLFDLLSVGDALVVPGDGCTHYQVSFRLVIFKPFIGEVMIGKIRGCSPAGVHVSLGFFDDILIPPEMLQENSTFNQNEQIWVWHYGEHELFMDIGSPIRFRIAKDLFVDTMPFALSESTQNVVAAPGAVGAESVKARRAASEQSRSAPYCLQGSIQEDGLGVLEWWRS